VDGRRAVGARGDGEGERGKGEPEGEEGEEGNEGKAVPVGQLDLLG